MEKKPSRLLAVSGMYPTGTSARHRNDRIARQNRACQARSFLGLERDRWIHIVRLYYKSLFMVLRLFNLFFWGIIDRSLVVLMVKQAQCRSEQQAPVDGGLHEVLGSFCSG